MAAAQLYAAGLLLGRRARRVGLIWLAWPQIAALTLTTPVETADPASTPSPHLSTTPPSRSQFRESPLVTPHKPEPQQVPLTPPTMPSLEQPSTYVSPTRPPQSVASQSTQEPSDARAEARRKESASNGSSARSAPKPLRNADQLPPFELLQPDAGVYGATDDREMGQRIEQTLEDFDVPVKVVHVESGPTVTQFGVEPQYVERAGNRRKIRVSRIVSLADDLALALEAPAVRIEAPVPGRPYVGIEVPNRDKLMVGLRGILESKELRKDGGALPIGLGRNTAGAPVVMDLARAPHMLIAGATGAGKSVCINAIITSLLMQHGPESLKFVMVDPKMVELPGYNGIPHLIGKVVTEMDQVMGMLTWLLLQMDDRYRTFKEASVRNIDVYNAKVRKMRGKDAPQPLPYIVLVVDELADLMMTAADDVETQLCRLAQMARATGIHLILATQRPSVDVVTGLIKANFPTRIAFAVTSQTDSRVILDTPGAERLLGRGDMLIMRSDQAKLTRVQGCWVADDEINAIASYWKQRTIDETLAAGGAERPVVPPWFSLMDRLDDEEELILDAIDALRDLESCSTSMLQRRLNIGYPKAARLMEELETRKVVGPDQGGGRGRKVLISSDADEEEDEGDEALF
ncbi:MAG: DNA translocase FtsK [Caldilineaceae bacterium]